MANPVTSEYVGAAHVLHAKGLRVFPCDHPDQPGCIGKHDPVASPCDGQRGKHPVVKWGVWAVAVTPQMIDLEWGKYGGLANIGISCGPSGLVVFDEDAPGELQRWCGDRSVALPDTYTVITDRGRHLYFRWDHSGTRIGNSTKAVDQYKLDVRGDGGFVIAAGSKHEQSNVIYTGNGLPIADLPPDVAAALLAGVAPPADFWAPRAGDPNATAITDGQRHPKLIEYAGRLRGLGLDYDEAEPTFRRRWLLCEQPDGQIPEAAFHSPTCRYPVTWDEAQAKLTSVYSLYAAGSPVADGQDVRGHLRDALLSVGALGNLTPSTPLIDGLIYRNTLAQLAGPPGSYKTFMSVAIACCLATRTQLLDHEIPERGKVIYVVTEGANDIYKRIIAWCEVADVEPEELDDWLLVLPRPIQLGDRVDVTQAVDVVRETGASMLILDTRARCTLGLEENSASEQGLAIANAERIRAAADCSVLAIHHTPRTGGAGRGSNAWDGAVWSDLRIESERMQARVHCEKHKDVESGCDHDYTLIPHTVSVALLPDLDQKARSTLVLSPTDPGTRAYLTTSSRQAVVGLTWNFAPPEGFTATDLMEMAGGVSKSRFYDATSWGVGQGFLRRVGTDRRSRWVPGPNRPSWLPDEN